MIKSSMLGILRILVIFGFYTLLDRSGIKSRTPEFWMALVLFFMYGILWFFEGKNR